MGLEPHDAAELDPLLCGVFGKACGAGDEESVQELNVTIGTVFWWD
jgi:hypothetical protein